MQRLAIWITVVLTVIATGQQSAAAVTLISVDSSPETLGGVDHIVNDLKIDFTGTLTGQALLITLTSGSMFQESSIVPGDTPPTTGLIGLVPDRAFDSFVTFDELVDPTIVPVIAGGATDLGGGSAKTFDTSGADISWFAPGGTFIVSSSDFTVARITLTDDAAGTWQFVATTTTGNGYVSAVPPTLAGPNVDLGGGANGIISGGTMSAVPEPSAGVLGAVSVIVFVGLRKFRMRRADPHRTNGRFA